MTTQLYTQDDLTKIKGIGPARQKWFAESFDVHSFADLAALSVPEVEDRLKADGRSVSHNEIKEWLVQASDLANEQNWKTLATFVVNYQVCQLPDGDLEFQTTAHYIEKDKNEEWPEIQGEQVCAWMERQFERPEPLSSGKPQPDLPQKPASKAYQVVAAQVHLRQTPDYDIIVPLAEEDRIFLGHISHEYPFDLQLNFQIQDRTGNEVWLAPQDFQAQCHIHNLGTGDTSVLELKPDDVENDVRAVQNVALPELMLAPGIYNLEILFKFGKPGYTNYMKLPRLDVH